MRANHCLFYLWLTLFCLGLCTDRGNDLSTTRLPRVSSAQTKGPADDRSGGSDHAGQESRDSRSP